MEYLQALMIGLSADLQNYRATTQMTLGLMIERLASMHPEAKVDGIGKPHSYRGYYQDLAFEKTKRKTTAGAALKVARACMGEVFQGYKGGDFQMGRNTPVWLASYGDCGMKIVAIGEDGTMELAEDE